MWIAIFIIGIIVYCIYRSNEHNNSVYFGSIVIYKNNLLVEKKFINQSLRIYKHKLSFKGDYLNRDFKIVSFKNHDYRMTVFCNDGYNSWTFIVDSIMGSLDMIDGNEKVVFFKKLENPNML